MDFTAFGPLIGGLLQAGSPMIATALQMGIGEIPIVGGIIGPLAGMAVPGILASIATRLGAPADSTPQQLAAIVASNPDAAKDKLASLEEQHQFALATDKQNQDFALASQKQQGDIDIASQAQQTAIETVEVSNPSWFVAGPRPAIMWGLGGLMMLSFALPFLVWVLVQVGLHLSDPPRLDHDGLMILGALLGITVAARSVDKATGTETKALGGTSKVLAKTTTAKSSR